MNKKIEVIVRPRAVALIVRRDIATWIWGFGVLAVSEIEAQILSGDSFEVRVNGVFYAGQ